MNWQQYSTAIRKFYLDNGFLHASALTFYSIFAVVPILATAFGIAKGFGLEDFLNLQIKKSFPGQETTVQFISQYAENLLSQSSGGLIAGVGLLVLFYSVYNMLSHIEQSLNNIWQVSEPRKISTRISHYLSLILIGPIILIVAGAVRLFISNQIRAYNEFLALFSNLLPTLLVIALFYWLYKYMPNIKVKASAAIFGASIAGLAYILSQAFLIESQLIMTNYSAVYGGFSALPIFLVWVQISWIIVLFGAQLCFVRQNKIQNLWQINFSSLSYKAKNALFLKVANLCIDRFNQHKPAPSIQDLADDLQLPSSLIRQLLVKLIDANILIKTVTMRDEHYGYQPANATAILTEDFILEAIYNCGMTYE